VGKNSIEIKLNEGATIRDLRNELAKQFPELGSVEKKIAVAINEQYVVDDVSLVNGDEVALIPPVSGG
jgi:molybdopterin converting factor subunit 1